MATRDLEREVFGGSDSELSEEEEISRPGPSAAQENYQSSGEESQDDYVSEKPRANKRRVRMATDGEDKATRKRKRRVAAPEIDLSELPPEQANKIRLDQQIEAILKNKKSRPRKKKANEEVLDSFADAEVARLREAMTQAAEDDIRANQEKQPAMAKLRMLDEAMETLRKSSLAQSIMDNNLLEAVRRWLEPLPDRSLPVLNIQREFFPMLKKMEFIDASVLKESGLGRIVIFYTKDKRVTAVIRKIAEDLVSTWSRPIIRRSASYKDRVLPQHSASDYDPAKDGNLKLGAIMARAREAEKNKVRRNVVSIPVREFGTYTVAPKSNAGMLRANASVDNDIERRKRNADRMRMLTRKMQGAK